MNALVSTSLTLPALVDRAAQSLAGARTSAEVLDARDQAGIVYDLAKKAARLAKAKDAHDKILAVAHRAQADALEIEATAKRRIADEYDAAQERGEMPKAGGDRKSIKIPNENFDRAIVVDAGLTWKQIHEARKIRAAEAADPGIIRRTLDQAIEANEEPTRAKINRVIKKKPLPRTKKKRRRLGRISGDNHESQHDRDLKMLLGMWEAACETAREEFQKIVNK
jgi:hypothetical protein